MAVAVAGLWATLAMKSASGVALAGGLILIMVWNAWRRRTTARWSVSLALLALGSVAVWQILSVALGWPGLSDTVQDMLTRHFTRPDAADPWAGWFRLLTHATLDWMRFWAAVLVGPVLVVGGAVVAYARFGYPALPWLAGPGGLWLARPTGRSRDLPHDGREVPAGRL